MSVPADLGVLPAPIPARRELDSARGCLEGVCGAFAGFCERWKGLMEDMVVLDVNGTSCLEREREEQEQEEIV